MQVRSCSPQINSDIQRKVTSHPSLHRPQLPAQHQPLVGRAHTPWKNAFRVLHYKEGEFRHSAWRSTLVWLEGTRVETANEWTFLIIWGMHQYAKSDCLPGKNRLWFCHQSKSSLNQVTQCQLCVAKCTEGVLYKPPNLCNKSQSHLCSLLTLSCTKGSWGKREQADFVVCCFGYLRARLGWSLSSEV